MTSQEVARTIIDQIEQGYNLRINIGGTVHKISFFKTIGAINLGYDENTLKFTARLGKGRPNIIVVIKLNSMDLYDIEFFILRKFECKSIKAINDVYADNLTQVLISELGL